VEIQKLAGKVPVLLVNTEAFEWKELREIRAMFMRARNDAKEEDGRPLITELRTVKVYVLKKCAIKYLLCS
jgi:platelet-activating factor acetylhydrolase